MGTTGVLYPASVGHTADTPWIDDAWNNPQYILLDDANAATITTSGFDSGDQSWVLKAYNFDFSSIPDDAVINGVICRVNAWYSAGSSSIDLMQLLDTDRLKVGTNQCSTPVALTSDNSTIITKGSSSDVWDNSLTATWVKNSNFGVALACIATGDDTDISINYVTLEIYYTVARTLFKT